MVAFVPLDRCRQTGASPPGWAAAQAPAESTRTSWAGSVDHQAR